MPTPASTAPGAAPQRRGIVRRLLRLTFGGKRALVAVPLLVLLGFVGWESTVYWWYYAASRGEYTGVIVKVSHKGSPLCRYESVEMRVGQQEGATVLAGELKEFAIDDAYSWLIPQFQEAERRQKSVTVQYRQDTSDVQAKPVAPPKNLPWRWCVPTSYHATGLVSSR